MDITYNSSSKNPRNTFGKSGNFSAFFPFCNIPRYEESRSLFLCLTADTASEIKIKFRVKSTQADQVRNSRDAIHHWQVKG